jgi:hypothetical protein
MKGMTHRSSVVGVLGQLTALTPLLFKQHDDGEDGAFHSELETAFYSNSI